MNQLEHMSFKCAEVLVLSYVRQCAIAPGGVPVCGSGWCAGASASLESGIHRGASAPPGARAACPAKDRCAFKEGGGVGLGRGGISEVVPKKGPTSELR